MEDSVAEFVDEVTSTVVSNGTFGASSSARVDGIVVVTIGITVGGKFCVVEAYFSWTNLSISISISLICVVICNMRLTRFHRSNYIKTLALWS